MLFFLLRTKSKSLKIMDRCRVQKRVLWIRIGLIQFLLSQCGSGSREPNPMRIHVDPDPSQNFIVTKI
jgi:hypothetical protein